MNVKNGKCIRRLSRKCLWASRRRNAIAIVAIALTTLLFTALFTITLSINSSYETYQFRQAGGYCHGSYKNVTEEQAKQIAAHPKVRQTGQRIVIGTCADGVFAKSTAELSYMDENCTKWSYATPTTGQMPRTDHEISMDTGALELLGITPELGAQIPLTFTMEDGELSETTVTDTFTLVGYWTYDSLMPTHYLNISRDYVEQMEKDYTKEFQIDCNVMLDSSVDIEGQMEQVSADLGYTDIRMGVNWGYTSSQLGSQIDPVLILAIAAVIVLVIFTGYLIIYNIFQISVTGDIRFYGLLKTIGTTPRQLKRIIRQQALLLCVVGIPVGLLLGYGVGAVLTPVALRMSTLGDQGATISTSPFIFWGSAVFALLTVLVSCAKPGRMAGKVSPVEATRYTEVTLCKKKQRATRGAKVHQMAWANLGRNKRKTALVVVSLALSVTLLDVLCTFVGGFDVEKYVSKRSCADFVVGTTDYFQFESSEPEYISEETSGQLEQQLTMSLQGSGYALPIWPQIWVTEEKFRADMSGLYSEADIEETLSDSIGEDGLYSVSMGIEGLDASLFEKLTVVDGDLAPLLEEDSHAIALELETDDYGNVIESAEGYKVGDTITVTYDDYHIIDRNTGEEADENTPKEDVTVGIKEQWDVDYTVCALVTIPYSMSYRYSVTGSYSAVLPVDTLNRDSGQTAVPMCFLFDTPDAQTEAEAESTLAEMTANPLSDLIYESKETTRTEFREFQQMFLILGGVLCAVIGMVGILNFFNAIMTGILSRRREFAVLQSIGMTRAQLRAMLVQEGIFYAVGSSVVSLLLSLVLHPLAGHLLENMFWFFSYHFSLWPVVCTVPVFILLGWLIPTLLYGQTAKHSVVEELRENT
jgi:putative ABC transport system permease protein